MIERLLIQCHKKQDYLDLAEKLKGIGLKHRNYDFFYEGEMGPYSCLGYNKVLIKPDRSFTLTSRCRSLNTKVLDVKEFMEILGD